MDPGDPGVRAGPVGWSGAGRRKPGGSGDDRGVDPPPDADGDPCAAVRALYDRALPQVYGYLVTRVGRTEVAEDLTAETFLAAVAAARREGAGPVSVAWLIGVARHKLVDHWRREGRAERNLAALGGQVAGPSDRWEIELDGIRARDVLAALGPHHRAALTLRYVDDLTVPRVAELLGRTVTATEALLTRARGAFRRAYDPEGSLDV